MPEVQHGGHVRIATPGNTYVAMKAIPHLTVRFQGVPVQPSLRVNGTICAVNPRSGSSSAGEDPEDPVLNDERDATDPNEKGDLLDEVERFLDKDSRQDVEDGPDWMFEEGEMKSADPGYVFCPAPHRKPILRLFTKHFCQHPLFPTRDGSKSTQDIRREAVYEMYHFCFQRGLREAWGYITRSARLRLAIRIYPGMLYLALQCFPILVSVSLFHSLVPLF